MSCCVVRVGMPSPGDTQPGLSLLPGGQAGSGGDFPCASAARSSTNEPSNWQHGNILCSLSSGKRRVRKRRVRNPGSPAVSFEAEFSSGTPGDPGQGAGSGSTLGWGAGSGEEVKEPDPGTAQPGAPCVGDKDKPGEQWDPGCCTGKFGGPLRFSQFPSIPRI